MLELSKLIGWLGFSLGIFISVPQVFKSIKTHSTIGVSKLTYILLLLACVCYTLRAIAIREWIFIISNAFQIVVAVTMLYLMRKYRQEKLADILSEYVDFLNKDQAPPIEEFIKQYKSLEKDLRPILEDAVYLEKFLKHQQ